MTTSSGTVSNVLNGQVITCPDTITIANPHTDIVHFADKSDIEDLKKDIFNLAVNINLLHKAIEELNEKNKNL